MSTYDVFTGTTDEGQPTLYVLPVIPEDAPPDVREGIARRRIVNAGGVCPCGARMVLPSRAERRAAIRTGRAIHIWIEHEDGCPAPLDEPRWTP